MVSAPKIRVLICDDSAVVRAMMRKILNRDPGIEVVGAASNPFEARDLILEKSPDVLTLDIEMPRLDGLSFLKIIMKEHPMPVIIISSLSQRGSRVALEALRLGAVDVLGKPNGSYSVGELSVLLVGKVKAAAEARFKSLRVHQDVQVPVGRKVATVGAHQPVGHVQVSGGGRPHEIHTGANRFHAHALILLGASTGGTEALRAVLEVLPAPLPPICIVQHIPPFFSRAFAERLNTLCALEVREAQHRDRCEPGVVLVAPGDFHLMINHDSYGYFVEVRQGPQVWHQRPAVDLLYKSALPHHPDRVLGGLMTGMGRDGAEGLLALRERGAATFAQDEATSVVYGMPRAAAELNAAGSILPLPNIAAHICQWAQRQVV